jgi:hypothetical protein
MMNSKLTIEVDHSGKPYIKVKTDRNSDDVRDNLVSRFREHLSYASCWCRVRFDDTAISGQPHFTIEPIGPHELAEELKMITGMVNKYLECQAPDPVA